MKIRSKECVDQQEDFHSDRIEADWGPVYTYQDTIPIRTNFMWIGLAFILFFPHRDNLPLSIRIMFIRLWKWRANLSGELFSKLRHVWTACAGRRGKDKCERKAHPHKVFSRQESYPVTCEQDRKSIQIRVNAIPIRQIFPRIESDNHYPDMCKLGMNFNSLVTELCCLMSLLQARTQATKSLS